MFALSSAQAENESRLSIGFTGSVYQDVTNTDIRAAVSVLIRKVAWQHFDKAESRFYETLSEMAADLKSRKVDVLAMPSEEFIELRSQVPLTPILVTASDKGTILSVAKSDFKLLAALVPAEMPP